VLDFRLAKSGQDQTVTTTRMVMGTPGYMAPEQREGKPADARTDIYAFACHVRKRSGPRVVLIRAFGVKTFSSQERPHGSIPP
jgi:serine/threonine protein kinase